MGSRIMHAIIASRIADMLPIEDRTSFLVGSVAPDAVTTKNESHFFRGEVRDYSRSVDYKGFLHKYLARAESLYILGYFTHLIADDVWLKGFNLAWLKNRMDADPDVYPRYHNDFRLLNGKLTEHYGVKDQLRETLLDVPSILDIDEVRASEAEAFIPSVLGDLDYEQAALQEPLQVFTFGQIVGYIETSVDLGLIQLRRAALLYRLPYARAWLDSGL
ncbi:zinc dependent phospholipase C family protein [Paenibacillus lycopersici]|uniref:Zinc dependent phospholipase C family protein n=1 Tax=Paenibacillus lycopersici TaxID=2704462 RepID=A0A6C0FUC1_9BACL|nr:zinc dependent phospholipase C family protein [Paenibacillus lycopersici]QHT58973.1 zinc dependent phospholipase C family protein [Paenibacillus lycopersici]